MTCTKATEDEFLKGVQQQKFEVGDIAVIHYAIPKGIVKRGVIYLSEEDTFGMLALITRVEKSAPNYYCYCTITDGQENWMPGEYLRRVEENEEVSPDDERRYITFWQSTPPGMKESPTVSWAHEQGEKWEEF